MRVVRSIFDLLRTVAHDYAAKRVSIIAAALAYYLFLALLPFMLVLMAAAGYVLGGSQQHVVLVSQVLERALPASQPEIQQQLQAIITHRAVVGGLGLLALAWSASSGFAILAQALRIVWEVRGRPRYLRARLRALLLVVIAVCLALISLLAGSVIPVLSRLRVAGAVIRFVELNSTVVGVGSVAISLAVSLVTLLFIYRIVPAPHLGLRHLAAGAGFAAVAWEVAKGGFAWYVRRFAHLGGVYGPLAAIVILLLWIYISVTIVLVGAGIASAYARREGKQVGCARGRSSCNRLRRA